MATFYPGDSFAGILTIAMEVYGVGSTRLSELLEDADPNIHITDKRISEYLYAKHTPSFEKARLMFDVMGYAISDYELKEALEKNKELVKKEKNKLPENKREFILSVRIKYKNIDPFPGGSPLQANDLLWKRIEELNDGKRDIAKYVQGLIKKDLREYILEEEEVAEIE